MRSNVPYEINEANPVYLSLGSNLAERRERIIKAVHEISLLSNTEITKVSSLYRTKPVGFQEQPIFLNLVLEIKTRLCPTCLLLALQAIEKKLGRIRTVRWGPRTIDIDMISYGNLVQNSVFLTLPHPHMAERNFVLIPLNEIAENYIVPGHNLRVGEIFKRSPDQSWVVKEAELVLADFRNKNNQRENPEKSSNK